MWSTVLTVHYWRVCKDRAISTEIYPLQPKQPTVAWLMLCWLMTASALAGVSCYRRRSSVERDTCTVFFRTPWPLYAAMVSLIYLTHSHVKYSGRKFSHRCSKAKVLTTDPTLFAASFGQVKWLAKRHCTETNIWNCSGLRLYNRVPEARSATCTHAVHSVWPTTLLAGGRPFGWCWAARPFCEPAIIWRRHQLYAAWSLRAWQCVSRVRSINRIDPASGSRPSSKARWYQHWRCYLWEIV